MTTIIATIAIILIVGAACTYIHKEKKKGNKCIGCPNAGECQKHSCCNSEDLYNQIQSL